MINKYDGRVHRRKGAFNGFINRRTNKKIPQSVRAYPRFISTGIGSISPIRWQRIPDEASLDLGNTLVFGKTRFVKNRRWLKLPDGRQMPIAFGILPRMSSLHNVITQPAGWEWFDGVRDEERFKRIAKQAKETANK